MKLGSASLFAVILLVGAAGPPPPDSASQYRLLQDGGLQDRGPQIMQMQLAAPARPGSVQGMPGAEAAVLTKRFIEGDTRPVPPPASTSTTSTPQ